jgi:hypothetical protein
VSDGSPLEGPQSDSPELDRSAARRAARLGRRILPRGRRAVWLSGVAALAVLTIVVVTYRTATTATSAAPPSSALGGPGGASSSQPADSPTTTSPTTTGPQATTGPTEGAAKCPAATVDVGDAGALMTALSQAKPGDSIHLRDGTYQGRFAATAQGTARQPIFLCGGAGAIIEGTDRKSGYGFHLDGANFWRLVGFTVRHAQKGVVLDRSQHVVIQGLTVRQIGDEGIHLRNFSTDNLVQSNIVAETGRVKPQFGEGIYVGTAQSNWGQISGGQPDKSDRNMLRGNTIIATTAESIDIKEGTTGGSIIGNTFDGSALSGANSAESWVNIKGNGWLIQGNTGQNSILHGFKTREVVKGWGHDNTFTANTADVNGPGYGFDIVPVNGNRVSCDNKVTRAALGLANVPCS